MEKSFFKGNRRNLMSAVDKTPIVLAAYREIQRVGDSAWRFEQEPNFWYLTGIEQADWRLVIADGKAILVAPEISEVAAIFSGQLDFSFAREISGVDAVITSTEGDNLVKELAKKHEAVKTIIPSGREFEFAVNPSHLELKKYLKSFFKKVENIEPEIRKLRAIKQKPEIMMLRRAINLTRSAFEIVKGELENYDFEYEAQARFSYEFERAGATHAYDPIVASGSNALTLHYNINRAGLEKNQLVLIDVGARYGGYSADITRTYANGAISDRRRGVHAAVVTAQREIIDLIKPGFSIRDYIKKSDLIMKDALESLGLYETEADFRKYFPHAVSHGLGVETHDTLGGAETFQPGMVLTVEPGIYIPEESAGVRIEDDILVTADGNENLSRGLDSGF